MKSAYNFNKILTNVPTLNRKYKEYLFLDMIMYIPLYLYVLVLFIVKLSQVNVMICVMYVNYFDKYKIFKLIFILWYSEEYIFKERV